MDEQRQDDQLGPTYKSYVLIKGVALKTSWERWTIKGEVRASGRPRLVARHDDDDVYCRFTRPRSCLGCMNLSQK